MKKLKGVRVFSSNGEIHHILQESQVIERPKISKNFNENEVKKTYENGGFKTTFLKV